MTRRKRNEQRDVRRLQYEHPVFAAKEIDHHAGHIVEGAAVIVNEIAARDLRYQRDPFLNRIAQVAGQLTIEHAMLKREIERFRRNAALLTDYDAAHELLRKEDG